MTLTFDLLTLIVVSESRMTWATSLPIRVFIGLSVIDLGLVYATDVRRTDRQIDRQTDIRRQIASLLNAPAYGWGIITDASKPQRIVTMYHCNNVVAISKQQ